MPKPLINQIEDLIVIVRNRSDISSSRQEIVDTLEAAKARLIEVQAENYRLKHLDTYSRMK